jgi:nucleotide-binding universal stress UspA family protein
MQAKVSYMSTMETKKQIGTFSKILVAIDGSRQSMDAGYYAIDMSNKFNAELYAIHVVKDPAYVEMFSFGIYDVETPFQRKSSLEHISQKAKEWFDEIKAKANEKNIQLSKAELIGTSTSVEAAIVDYAEKNDIDLIFLGTKGYSGIKKLLLGSVASAVLTYAHCPVMVIR